MSEWMPIETAPKDGTTLLLYGFVAGEVSLPSKQKSIDIGRWIDGHSDYDGDHWWKLVTGDYYTSWMLATHWMPLPEPPK